MLIQAAEKRARNLEASISRVKLSVLETNDSARKCYAKAGFRVYAESSSSFPPCKCSDGACHCTNKISWLKMEKHVA